MTSFFIHTVTRVAWRYRACYSIPKHFLTLHFFCYLCVSSTHRKGRHNFSQVDLFPYGDEINPHKEIDSSTRLRCLPFRCGRHFPTCDKSKSEKARNFTNEITVNVSKLAQTYPAFLKK